LSYNYSYVEVLIPCPGCGSPTPIPEKSGDKLKCKICDFEAIHNKNIRYCSYLKFDIGDNKEKMYRVSGDIVIGRNRRHQLILKDPIKNTVEVIPIRIPEVSEEHSKISTSETYEIREIDGKKNVINLLCCSIEDRGSSNGTEVDGQLLKPREKRELKDGNKIKLAPNERQFVEIEYLVRRDK
jgi:hypothetical protein